MTVLGAPAGIFLFLFHIFISSSVFFIFFFLLLNENLKTKNIFLLGLFIPFPEAFIISNLFYWERKKETKQPKIFNSRLTLSGSNRVIFGYERSRESLIIHEPTEKK